jgi:hypothetical protein
VAADEACSCFTGYVKDRKPKNEVRIKGFNSKTLDISI